MFSSVGGVHQGHFPQWITLHLGTLKISEVFGSELFSCNLLIFSVFLVLTPVTFIFPLYSLVV